jgi:D-amino peptidase
MRIIFVCAFVAALVLAVAVTQRGVAAQSSGDTAKKMKVYISVDMEGVAGVVTPDQLGPTGFEYERARKFMTSEALAAVQGAREAGAGEFVVSDSHGNGENLLIDEFPTDVRIVRAWPRHGGMMAGLDSSFAAAIFVGYHASTTNPNGVRAHTFSSAHYARVGLNGNSVTEGEFNAAYAGAKGVPVIFASGDDVAVAELKSRLGNIETVETKKALSFHSAESVTPQASFDRIYHGVQRAVTRIREFKPYIVSTPVTLEITFKNYMPAEVLSFLKVVTRVDAHTIRYVGKDMDEVEDFEEFISNYSPDLAP